MKIFSIIFLTILLLTACRQSSPTDKQSVVPVTSKPVEITGNPEWDDQAVMYEVNLRQYTPEGTFSAFGNHVDRLAKMGVDKLLKQACKEGKVLAGSSAGAICWFQYGHSDSIFYYHPEDWDWIRVKCLGILPFTACPHCLKEGRMEHFVHMIKRHGGTGIALDDCTALQIAGDQFRILRSKQGAQAFLVSKLQGKVITTPLPETEKFQSLSKLN